MEDRPTQAQHALGPSRAMEVVVAQLKKNRKNNLLRELNWGTRRIADEMNLSRNPVRRYIYMQNPAEAVAKQRSGAHRLDADMLAQAAALFDKKAAGNAVVVHRLLQEMQASIGILQTVQRAVKSKWT